MCIIQMNMEYLSFSREVSQVDKHITKNVDSTGRILIIYSDFLYPKGSSCEVFYGKTEKTSRNVSHQKLLQVKKGNSTCLSYQ